MKLEPRKTRPIPSDSSGRKFEVVEEAPWVPAVLFAPCPFVWPDETAWPYRPDDWCYPSNRQSYPMAVMVGEQIHWKNDLVLGIAQRGTRISSAVYDWLMARREWCRKYAPGSPEARPAVIQEWRGRKRWEI